MSSSTIRSDETVVIDIGAHYTSEIRLDLELTQGIVVDIALHACRQLIFWQCLALLCTVTWRVRRKKRSGKSDSGMRLTSGNAAWRGQICRELRDLRICHR